MEVAATAAIIDSVAFGRRRRGSGDKAPEQQAPALAPQQVTTPPVVDLSTLPPPHPADMAAPIPPLQGDATAATVAVPIGGGDGTQPRPGWYPDPAGEKPYRWWDGNAWTYHAD